MSYFLEDIPFMSKEELRENEIRIPKDATDTDVGDKISKFIDGLEETFAYIREREGGDSVCGLCEYDGAYIGESGDWCNECPGFNRDDCFKLSEETRKKWTDEIIKALPTVQPERDIPKKPNETTDRTWGIPHRQAVCPNCDAYLGMIHFISENGKTKVTYCESCGQAIDWEGWKEDE